MTSVRMADDPHWSNASCSGPAPAFLFPKLDQFGACAYRQFHVLHGHPFEQAMGVVFATEQVGSGKTPLRQARTIGAATHQMVIGLQAHCGKSFTGQFHRTHILTQPVGHVAVLLADPALDSCVRLCGL